MTALLDDIPIYEPDVFAPDALREPFEHYRALRNLGAVVRLRDPDVYVLSRFDDVEKALHASDALACSSGVGFSDQFNKRGGPNLLASDGDQHRRMRKEVIGPLMPGALKQHRQFLKDLIGAKVKSLVGCGRFNAMTEIAQFLPTKAISILVGLPEAGRAAMLDWAAANFNAVGPAREEFRSDFALVAEAFAYFKGVEWTDMREGSWARALENTITTGKLSEAEARGALSAYVMPSLDTTILSKGHLIHNLGRNPDQWRQLKADPSLAPKAVVEAVRHSAVVRWFSRLAKTDYQVEGRVIPEGSRVMLIYASANRDERRFADPDRYDLARDTRGQLAWGSGAHICGGMHLAKLEMEVMLEALLEHCDTLETGEPEVVDNRGLYGFRNLPIELRAAAIREDRSDNPARVEAHR